MDTLRAKTERIKARAISLGFSLSGVTDASPLKQHLRYMKWIQQNHHAGMEYLNSSYHLETRADPSLLFPGVRSILVVGMSYSLHDYSSLISAEGGLISGYAAGEDYHTRIPAMLAELQQTLSAEFPGEVINRCYSDSAPILERELAQRSGMGWIGRNSCLISPELGSSLLLAEVFTTAELEIDAPFLEDRCGECRRCIQACPTGCIQADRTIDSRRCLSYQTIENRGEIPSEIKQQCGGWIFGCDICQMVCPWNSKRLRTHPIQQGELLLTKKQLVETLNLTESDFRQIYGSTALARTKRIGLIRNVLIRLGNLAAKDTSPAIRQFIQLNTDPNLISTAQWALEQIEDQ